MMAFASSDDGKGRPLATTGLRCAGLGANAGRYVGANVSSFLRGFHPMQDLDQRICLTIQADQLALLGLGKL